MTTEKTVTVRVNGETVCLTEQEIRWAIADTQAAIRQDGATPSRIGDQRRLHAALKQITARPEILG